MPLPTSWSNVFMEKLVFPQPVNKFPRFYATQIFTALFQRTLHLSLSFVRWIQLTPSYPIYTILSNFL